MAAASSSRKCRAASIIMAIEKYGAYKISVISRIIWHGISVSASWHHMAASSNNENNGARKAIVA
jgi:hypothetical protein